MKILLQRIALRENYTIGKLSVNDKYLCDTLEDCVRPNAQGAGKIAGQTAIPAGIYPVDYTYSYRFKTYLPELKNVPNFTAIRIHAGNTDKDTQGCVLVGENKIKGQVINSRSTLAKLLAILEPAYRVCEAINIEIKEK
jgi:hypothetical protein